MNRERELLYRWYRGARDQVDFGELFSRIEKAKGPAHSIGVK